MRPGYAVGFSILSVSVHPLDGEDAFPWLSDTTKRQGARKRLIDAIPEKHPLAISGRIL
jgi:hypothetical protein